MFKSSALHKIADRLEDRLCRLGLRRGQTWEGLLRQDRRLLYAGRLRRGLPQYRTHFGITPFFRSGRNIHHDVTRPYPIPNGSIDRYQSEDVFEHVPMERQVDMFNEIHRVLRPGGLFRLSLPDYNFDQYRDRSSRDEEGNIIFDPGGLGRYVDSKVVDGGHLWFPTIGTVRALIESSAFRGSADYLHYTEDDETYVIRPIDYSLGHVQRTPDHDDRVKDRPRPISIVVDLIKH